MSMGSQSGNRHVHWHVASLPPGVPYEEQQFAAFSWKRGVVALPDDDMADLARRIQGSASPWSRGRLRRRGHSEVGRHRASTAS
jgi:hypothetical protein